MVGFVGRFIIVFGILFSIFLFKERCTFLEGVMIFIIPLGGFVLTLPATLNGNFLGVLVALAYAFCFAWSNALMKVVAKNISSIALVFNYSLVWTAIIFIYCLSTQQKSTANFSDFWFFPVLSGLATLFGMVLYIEGSKLVSYMTLNVMRSLTPFIVALYSYWFFSTALLKEQWIGGGIMTFALIGLGMARRRVPKA